MSRYIGVDMLRTVTDNFRFLHTGNYDYNSGFGDCGQALDWSGTDKNKTVKE